MAGGMPDDRTCEAGVYSPTFIIFWISEGL
jgi:hypothetical protein